MMLLNLISPQMRETLRQQVILSSVRTLVVMVVCVELVFVGVLAVGDFQLKAKTKRVTQESELSTLLLRAQGQVTIADTTKLLNSQVKALQDLQKRYVSWVPPFQKISELTPPGISLSGIEFNQATEKVTLRGVAATRESYTRYEKVLQGSTLLTNVTFPLQTKKTDLGFDITTSFKVPHE